jgi:hypothetical protein
VDENLAFPNPICCGTCFGGPLKLLNGQSAPEDQTGSGEDILAPQSQSPWQFIEEELPERTPGPELVASTRVTEFRPPALPVGRAAGATEKGATEMSQAEAWELLARRLESFRPEPASDLVQEEASEEEVDGPDTGLSGLRKLLLSPGMKASQSREIAAQGAAARPPVEALPVRTVPPRSYTPLPRGPAGKDESAASSRENSGARNPPFESEEKEHAWDDADNARRDRRDPVDPVQILPSWRGQYKKKKK